MAAIITTLLLAHCACALPAPLTPQPGTPHLETRLWADRRDGRRIRLPPGAIAGIVAGFAGLAILIFILHRIGIHNYLRGDRKSRPARHMQRGARKSVFSHHHRKPSRNSSSFDSPTAPPPAYVARPADDAGIVPGHGAGDMSGAQHAPEKQRLFGSSRLLARIRGA